MGFAAPGGPDGPIPASQPTATAGACAIKGNISRQGEKVFHVPGSRDYDRTRISVKDGERMFCTEDEARAARMARTARVIAPDSRFTRISRWLTDRLRPRRFRHEIEAKATALIAVHGLLAYAEARKQARMDRTDQSRFWGHVAIEIARREGREVGLSGSDRFPGV